MAAIVLVFPLIPRSRLTICVPTPRTSRFPILPFPFPYPTKSWKSRSPDINCPPPTTTEAAPQSSHPRMVLPPASQDRKTGRRFQSFAKTYQFYLLQTASLFLASPSGHCPCSGHCQGVSIGVSASTSAPDFQVPPKGISTNAVEHIASCLRYAKNSHHLRTTSRVLGRVHGALISDLSCPPIVASCYSLRAPTEQPALECAGLWHPEPWHRAPCS